MIELAAPYFLIGLLAFIVPIIVHLLSKNTRHSVAFGSIRFLKETETKTMRSIMPSQWLLLLLRMLLLCLLILLTAEPFMNKKRESVKTMFLVDPKYADSPWFQSWKDSLNEDEKAFWLSENFPTLSEEIKYSIIDYWNLLTDPPQLNAEKIVVISPLLVKDFKGARAPLPILYEWMKLPVDPKEESSIAYLKNDQSFLVNTTFDEWETRHAIQKIDNAEPLSISYFIKSSEAFVEQSRIIETAISTLNELSPLALNKTLNIEDVDWTFWLSSDPAPKRANILLIDTLMISKWKAIGFNRIHLADDLKMSDAVKMNLPKKLLDLLAPVVTKANQLTMDVNTFTYEEVSIESEQAEQESAASIFWILLLVGLIIERWASFKSENK